MKYLLGELLGSGGMGAVYKAWDTRLQRPVAVKVMSPASPVSEADLQQFTQLFQAEALRLASLKHSGIPHIYDHFEEAGRWFLVMEFIEGETLKDAQDRRGGPLPVDEALTIGFQLADVLDYLHQRQPPVIFRDLKPANAMLAPGGQVYLIDFGIARLFTPGKSQDTFLFLSPGYAAPEQHGTAQTTERSDIFSLGATLHHLLSGAHPASSPFLFALLPIQQPTQLAPLIAQMVALDPANRPASMAVVKAALQGMRGQAAGPSTSTDPVFFAPTQPSPQLGIPGPAPVAQPAFPNPQSAPQAVAACEIPLPDGRLCGIPPIGRCTFCGRAFCTTHQARTRNGGFGYTDVCVPCFPKTPEEVERVKEEEARRALQFFRSGAAKAALLAARVPTVEIYWRQQGWKPKKGGFFSGGQSQQVEVITPVGRGWILGTFSWFIAASGYVVRSSTEDHLTALLVDVPNSYNRHLGLVRVQRVSEGYEVFLPPGEYDSREEAEETFNFRSEQTIKAMQAVKRLAGESS